MENTKEVKMEKNLLGEEKYLHALFSIVRKTEVLTIVKEKTRFNGTEIRLIGEVLGSMRAGKRVISTQLAQSLGVTRSAISQIVNRLETQGVVKRVADTVDRKIAYIELTDETLDLYGEDLKVYVERVNKLVKKFGEARFEKMCGLFHEFCTLVETEKKKGSKIKKCKSEK